VTQFNRHRFFIFFVLISLISACGILGTRHPEMHGRVMHEVLDKPLPHTIVVALWKGKEIKNNTEKEICYHVEATKSDDKGYFSIPEWREPSHYENLKDKAVQMVAFRRYYRTSELTSERMKVKNNIYYLTKPRHIENEEKARDDRLRYLQQLIGKTSCDLKGESRTNLRPLFSEIIEEAELIAVTEKDRKVVEKLKGWLSFVSTPQEN